MSVKCYEPDSVTGAKGRKNGIAGKKSLASIFSKSDRFPGGGVEKRNVVEKCVENRMKHTPSAEFHSEKG